MKSGRTNIENAQRPLSHAKLRELGSLVTPDTLTRWFRQYAGAKYDSHAKRGPGRSAASA